MGKFPRFFVLFVATALFSGCNESFQNTAKKRFDFVIDSINKGEMKNDQVAISYKGKPNETTYKKDALICCNDTAFIQTFNCHWTTYTGESADKLCFFAICKSSEGKTYELLKPIAWLERVQVDTYISKLNERKALIDAIYKACLIAGEEKHF